MFKIFLGEIKGGRLQRLSFLGFSLLLNLIVIGFLLTTVMVIGVGEQVIGGELQQAQDVLRERFTLPFFIVFGLLMPLFVFAGFNMMAKRIRDIGLPGWWTLLAIIVLEGIVSYAVSQEVAGNMHVLVTVILLLIPGNTFENRETMAN